MKTQTFRAGLLVAAVAVAACDDSTSAPDANLDAIEDDVALIAADAAAGRYAPRSRARAS